MSFCFILSAIGSPQNGPGGKHQASGLREAAEGGAREGEEIHFIHCLHPYNHGDHKTISTKHIPKSMSLTLKGKLLDMGSPHGLDSKPACTSSQLCGECVYAYRSSGAGFSFRCKGSGSHLGLEYLLRFLSPSWLEATG